VVGNRWEFSARKRRPAVLAPWERPSDKPVMKATPVAAGNRIPNGVDRRLSKEGGFAYVGVCASPGSSGPFDSSIAMVSSSKASLGEAYSKERAPD